MFPPWAKVEQAANKNTEKEIERKEIEEINTWKEVVFAIITLSFNIVYLLFNQQFSYTYKNAQMFNKCNISPLGSIINATYIQVGS